MKTTRSILILALAVALGILVPGRAAVPQQTAGELFEKALYIEEGQGGLQKAIGFYQDIVKRFPDNREVAAKAQLHIGLCLEKLGLQEAEKAFQKVVSDFPEQKEAVDRAREKLSLLVKARSVLATANKGLNVRLIWSGPEAETAGHASPDGSCLSFIDEKTGNLCIKEIASGKQIIVVRRDQSTKPYEFPTSSRWSPDGKTLAYSWFNRDISGELRTIGTDGSKPRTLYARKNEMVFPLAWSPDGKFIAAGLVRDFYKSYDMSLIAVDDGSMKVLKTPKLLGTAPRNMAFSPDSRYLVIDLPQGENDPRHDIFALSADGAQEFRVVEHPGEDTVLGWIPGSDGLLFSSDRTGTQDAWIVDVADGRPHGEPRLVRKNLGQVTPLGISREGSLFYSMGITMWDIFTASIDLEKRVVIEPPKIIPQPMVGADHQPQWSPDGKYLVFFSIGKAEPGARGRMALKIRTEDTGETREIITNLRWVARPSWAPDGRSLFVIGSDGKNTLALFQVQVPTGQTTFLINSEAGANIKFITPASDGKSVFYTYFEFAKKRCRIMGIDLATRETRELYRQEAPPDIGGLGVSPDGKQLVFGTLAPDDSLVLKAIPLPGGPPREIIKSKASAFGVSINVHGAFCWTPDGKRILFFRDVLQGQDKKSELCSMPVEGGEIQSHGLVVQGSPDVFSLHPDGRRLAFSVGRSSAEIWVMENFLPPITAKGGQELSLRKLRLGPEVSLFHSVSPDGKYISGADENTYNLSIMELATGKKHSLTTNPDSSWYPEHSLFSPDGRQIAYVWSSWKTELNVVGIDGSNPRTLLQDKFRVYPAGWTPDGRHILALAQDKEGPVQLVLIAVTDGSMRILKTFDSQPSWQVNFSPDGKYVAYSAPPRVDAKGLDIFVLAVDRGRETRLTDHPANDMALGWTPDGRGLLFASDRTGSVGAWFVAILDGRAEGQPQMVKQDIGRIKSLGFAKDASFFYMQDASILRVNLVDLDPLTGKGAGTPVPISQPLDMPVYSLDWSPDGQSFAYVTDRKNVTDPTSGTMVYDSRAIAIRSLGSGEERLLLPSMKTIVNINWSPDGRSFLLRGHDANGSVGLHIMDAQNGKLMTSMPGGYWGSWSRDGKAVFYCKNDAPSKSTRLVARDLNSGEDKVLFPGPVGMSVAASPDGERLAFSSSSEGSILYVMALKTGQNHEIHRLKSEDFGGLAWSSDSRRIYFVRRKFKESKHEIWQIPAEGGEPQSVGLSASPITQISIHPDGKRMGYSNNENRSELWVMENFLPVGKKRP